MCIMSSTGWGRVNWPAKTGEAQAPPIVTAPSTYVVSFLIYFFSFVFAFLCYPPLILIPSLKVLFSSSRNSLKYNLKVLLIKSWDGLFYETKSDILTGFAWLASSFVLVLNIFEIIPLCLSKCIGWSLYTIAY